jgi:pyroglutamyl-peptidase
MIDDEDTRPVVLLTGFGPFPGVIRNASADLVKALAPAARREFPDFRFVAAILPTEWLRAPSLVEILHERFRPSLALHFGVASGIQSVRLETQALNQCRTSPDAIEMLPVADTLCADGPERRCATIDIAAIINELGVGGWPCTTSDDAGGYLCNAVLYHSLASAEDGAKVGFVHIPAEVGSPARMMTAIAAAAVEIIGVALRSARTTTRLSA